MSRHFANSACELKCCRSLRFVIINKVNHNLLAMTTTTYLTSIKLDHTMYGERIKQLRKALGNISQEKLGKLAGGISKAAVSAWEREIAKPETDHLLVLEKKCNVIPEWIRTGKGEMFHTPEGVKDGNEENRSYYVDIPQGYDKLNRRQKQLIESLIKEIISIEKAIKLPPYGKPRDHSDAEGAGNT